MEKKVILKSLELSHFRGQSRKIDFNANATMISGINGSGKTTIFNAWLWLLTSYTDPNNIKNFNLFDNREEISPDTPKASVKAIIEVNGYEYSIEKIAEAKFVRKRGSDVYEKAPSDTYTIKLDDIETSATAFNAWLESTIGPIELIPYCLDGHFFTELLEDKPKARKILEGVVGEVKREDMNGDYSLIDEDMLRYSVDQIEERTKVALKPLKARMLEIPAIIDSKSATLAEYARINFDSILSDIGRKKEEIEGIDNRILGNGRAIEPILGRRDEILEIINLKTLSLNDRKVIYMTKESAEINALKAKIDEIKRMNAMADTAKLAFERKKSELTSRVARYESEVLRLEARREALINDRDFVKARIFVGETCAYCGQELPFEMQEKAREKFNESRSRELEDIVTRGKNNNLEIERVKASIEEAKNELAILPMPSKKVDTMELEEELARLQSSLVPFEDTEEYAKLVKEIEDLKATMPVIPTNDNEALTSAKRALMNDLDELNRKYGLKYKMDEIVKEIEELKLELRGVGAEIAKLEGKIDKCREFKQEKADIVSFRVNDKLKGCSIDMWSMQKDGTLIPDVVLRGKDGVKFGSLNFSDQIKVRIEMQTLFMESLMVGLPIFIDEYSVFSDNNRPMIDGQSVCLYATNSPYLVVE
jgi:chromosome segregation ATPase